jgi:hypothetical protein
MEKFVHVDHFVVKLKERIIFHVDSTSIVMISFLVDFAMIVLTHVLLSFGGIWLLLREKYLSFFHPVILKYYNFAISFVFSVKYLSEDEWILHPVTISDIYEPLVCCCYT